MNGISGAIAMFAMLGFALGAYAETVSIKGNSRTQVQGRCGNQDGGVFWQEGKTGHTYGCMNADGSGIVCGGVTKEQKQTCDTFRMAPKPINVPHRGDFGTEKKG